MDRDPFDLVGDVLDGQFRVDSFAGEGDLSVVYKGHHLGVDATVAIKCLDLPATLDASHARPLVDSFKEASRIHYRLARGNLNIAQSIASGTTVAPRTGTVVPYLVREWFEGESLAADLARRRDEKKTGRPVPEAIALLEAAFDGVSYAHQQGEVHFSLNPSNLFLATRSEGVMLKVLDFGVASAMNDAASGSSRSLRVLFPAYAAPEQLDRSVGEQGPWTDVYALALIVLEVLSDRMVMSEQDTGAVIERALDERRRPTPQGHGLKLPRNLEIVLTRALLLAPDRRQRTATDLWRDIKSAMRPATSLPSQAAAVAPGHAAGLSLAPAPAPAPELSPAPPSALPPLPARSVPLRAKAPTLVGMGIPAPAVVVGAVGGRLKLPSTPSVETQPMSFEPRSVPMDSFGVEPETVPKTGTLSPPGLAPVFPSARPSPSNGASEPTPSAPPANVMAPAAQLPQVAPLVGLGDGAPAMAPEAGAPAEPSGAFGAVPPSLRERAGRVAREVVRTLLAVAEVPSPGAPAVGLRNPAVAAAGIAAGALIVIVTIALVATRRPAVAKPSAELPPPRPTASAVVAPPETAAPAPSPPPPPPTPPAPAPAGPFRVATARRALDATSRDVAKCRRDKKWGTAFATVTFSSDGTVSHVDVGAPFRGTPAGECVADGLGAARIAPFDGTPGVVVYRFFIGLK